MPALQALPEFFAGAGVHAKITTCVHGVTLFRRSGLERERILPKIRIPNQNKTLKNRVKKTFAASLYSVSFAASSNVVTYKYYLATTLFGISNRIQTLGISNKTGLQTVYCGKQAADGTMPQALTTVQRDGVWATSMENDAGHNEAVELNVQEEHVSVASVVA